MQNAHQKECLLQWVSLWPQKNVQSFKQLELCLTIIVHPVSWHICYVVHYQQVSHNMYWSLIKTYFIEKNILRCRSLCVNLCLLLSRGSGYNRRYLNIIIFLHFPFIYSQWMLLKTFWHYVTVKSFLIHFQHFIFHKIVQILLSAPA